MSFFHCITPTGLVIRAEIFELHSYSKFNNKKVNNTLRSDVSSTNSAQSQSLRICESERGPSKSHNEISIVGLSWGYRQKNLTCPLDIQLNRRVTDLIGKNQTHMTSHPILNGFNISNEASVFKLYLEPIIPSSSIWSYVDQYIMTERCCGPELQHKLKPYNSILYSLTTNKSHKTVNLNSNLNLNLKIDPNQIESIDLKHPNPYLGSDGSHWGHHFAVPPVEFNQLIETTNFSLHREYTNSHHRKALLRDRLVTSMDVEKNPGPESAANPNLNQETVW